MPFYPRATGRRYRAPIADVGAGTVPARTLDLILTARS